MPKPTYCAGCGASFMGEPIPEKDRHLFGGASHFMRYIALYDRDLDCTVAFRCPDCGYTWKRDYYERAEKKRSSKRKPQGQDTE